MAGITRLAGTVRLALFTAAALMVGGHADAAPERPAAVVANDNRTSAGTTADGTLTVALRAGRGSWQPEGPNGPALTIEALGEETAPLMVPAPLIRAAESTRIAVSVRNDLDVPLVFRGLCAHDGQPCAPLTVPPHEVGRTQFVAGRAGTYHYWASALGAPMPFRELGGAFIVDRDGGPVEPDRIFVITEWSSLSAPELGRVMSADDSGKAFAALNPGVLFVINGLSWPATERLSYRVGDTAKWRVINLTSQWHPMHLHGFYFEVTSVGDGLRDRPVDRADRHAVVTQLLPPAATIDMTWVPERAGNWLFHCHVMHHVSSERRLKRSEAKDATHSHDHGHEPAHGHDAAAGMAGMILGVTVTERPATPVASDTPPVPARQLSLVIERRQTRHGGPGFGFSLSGDGIAAGAVTPSAPGPLLLLRRGQPVEITVTNRLDEGTALHWHGMELESYYDGVHNWSGMARRLSPMVDPGASFVVRFTPPRTGTFMYHTHLHDERQLPLGLYGPMLVVDDPARFDPETDHVVLVGRSGLDPAAPNVLIPATPLVINGESSPVFVWKAGARHRVRLINITPDDILEFGLQAGRTPLSWTPATKDGAPVPESTRQPVPATQVIAVGETYDFDVDIPAGRRTLWMEVRTPAGKWGSQAQVIAR